MHKATVVYVSMAVVSALLLWVILSVGRHLTPPENLGGIWEPLPAGTGPGKLRVEQSGHFFQIAFDDGRRADVKLVKQDHTGDAATMRLAGGGWTFDVDGRLSSDAAHWAVTGPTTTSWDAHRDDPHSARGAE